MMTNDFQVKIEATNQWEQWSIDLESTLKMIIRSKNIPLLYVIRTEDELDLTSKHWAEKARMGATHTGATYIADTLSVHNIITHDISEASDAYTYIIPKIKRSNGRIDIKALGTRYANVPVKDMAVNEAKKLL